MIHLICLTKSYNENDFKLWYNWHKLIGIDQIHILDNESIVPIYKLIDIDRKDTYQSIKNLTNKWQLFSDILNENYYNFQNDDIILFLDDDEFLWYDMNLPLKNTILNQFKMLDCIMLPQILMSSKNILKQRSTDLIQHSIYRRNDLYNQGKCILLYSSYNKYDFTKEENNESGFIPFINNMRYSDVVGSNCSKTTYGIVDYNAPLRLYHYYIKSLDDWNKNNESDITKNKWFNDYNVPDLSMQQLREKLFSKTVRF